MIRTKLFSFNPDLDSKLHMDLPRSRHVGRGGKRKTLNVVTRNVVTRPPRFQSLRHAWSSKFWKHPKQNKIRVRYKKHHQAITCHFSKSISSHTCLYRFSFLRIFQWMKVIKGIKAQILSKVLEKVLWKERNILSDVTGTIVKKNFNPHQD